MPSLIGHDVYCCLTICNRFRWVFCQMEVLRYCFPSNLRRVLEELPKSLDDTYKRILREINNANQAHAYRLLQCLTVASRPLRVEELAEVLAFDLSPGGIPKLNVDWRWENQEEAVLSACSSLVSVIIEDGSRVVQFSHFSVKEFLTSDRLAGCIEESQFYIPIEPSHTILAQACLGVLLCLDEHTERISAQKLPLYRYATEYWVGHARMGNVELVIKDTLDRFFDMDRPHFSSWNRLGGEYSNDDLTDSEDEDTSVLPSAASLYFAAWRGLHGVVERLLIRHPQHVRHLGGSFGTPLHAAAHGGHIEIAQFLFAHGADVNLRSAHNATPLHFASEMGHLTLVKWLLDHRANVNPQDARGHIPLHYSAHGGHIDVCRMLLEHGAVANTQGKTGSTPFLEASQSGHIDTIRLLLDHNPDVNVRELDGGWCPLHFAAINGHLQLVQKLLELNAEVDSCTHHKSTPLLMASELGHTDVVRLLLNCDADVYARDNDLDTPLHCAAGDGHLEITRMLLERGADINCQNNDGSTPLLRTAGDRNGGNSDIVRLLLDHGADVQVPNYEGKTASQLASDRERHEIVRLLSQHVSESTSGTGDRVYGLGPCV